VGNILGKELASRRQRNGRACGVVFARLLVASLLATPACVRDTPVGPDRSGVLQDPPALTPTESDQASEAVEDGLFRLLPGVGDSAGTRELQAALAGLRAGLTVAAPQELGAGVLSARAALDRLRPDMPLANPPDLDAIGLILDRIETLPRAHTTAAARQQAP